MPTLNPRINVTLSPSLDLLVSELAGLERVSKSTVLRELLEAAEPGLRQAIALMKAAQGASAKVRQNLATDMQAGLRDLERSRDNMVATIAHHHSDLVDQAQTVRGRRQLQPARLRRGVADTPAPAEAARPALAVGKTARKTTPPLIGVVSPPKTGKTGKRKGG